MCNEIYLDNSATTKPYDEVNDLVYDINKNFYANPSSLHSKGIEAERKINSAREIIAKNLGAEPKQIIFTSGGTESNNLAIRGYLDANQRRGKHVIATKIEHPSVLEVCRHLESTGYRVDYLSVSHAGLIDTDELKSKITAETTLISIIMVNNETGSIQPVEEAVKIKNAVNPDAVIHSDAVQAFGKLHLTPVKSGIDLLSVSSHKIHGPKGIGALYISDKTRLKPVVYGGGQESTLRSGTENVSGICGFGLAAEITCGNMDSNGKKVTGLKRFFLEKLVSCDFKFKVISNEKASPYILNISFENLKSEVLLHHLEARNIFVSTGSACSSRKKKQSHVLQSMGLPSSIVEGALRFSFSAWNTEEEIVETILALQEIVPQIQFGRNKQR
ncbi:MAG: cysteine desulfurase [Ruminiclostridium sp.]|nr:cysteine desulfurase [Ruminiclostridium sp.]